MRVLVCSTYELGAQPLGCALPAAVLRQAGHEVRARDCSLAELAEEDVAWADAACVSVPMHTALRLAVPMLRRFAARRHPLPVALHGLYAPVAAEVGLLPPGSLAVAGEVAPALLAWLGELSGAPGAAPGAAAGGARPQPVRVELGPPRADATVPDRSGLPGLERYARFAGGPAGRHERLVGALETTRGCSHRCRHCPVPVVYDGRTRAVDLGAVLADVDALVELGAGHLHVADPDFLNRPRHAMDVARAVHARHPELSFDVTVKVSHVLRHEGLWPELAELGCALVVSAVESVSETVLERLDKGHTGEEAAEAVRVLRRAGIEVRPSLLPFTPWTTRDDVVELLDFAARLDLVESVDAVQWGIRLLLPYGSLLLRDPDPVLEAAVERAAGSDGEESLGVSWRHADPLLDELAQLVAARTEQAAASGEGGGTTYADLRRLVHEALGRDDPGQPLPDGTARSSWPAGMRPRLTESWFCCAEPTGAQLQLATVGGAAVGGAAAGGAAAGGAAVGGAAVGGAAVGGGATVRRCALPETPGSG